MIPTQPADYGFAFNTSRDSYEVEEDTMSVIRRIFHYAGVEGLPLHRIKKLFDTECISPPKGGRYWSKRFTRSRILDDVYKPHPFDEVKKPVSPEVAARLDPEKHYGIWSFNVRRTASRQVVEVRPDGRS